MSEKPSPPKTMRGFAADSMSTANFQALRAKAKAAGSSSPSASSDTGARADSRSTANFQALAATAKPAAPAVKPAAPASAKGG
jgi:hypothetical protein